jgi:hypothetical protein
MGASPPALVADLVELFERDRKVFLSADYKEEQLRAQFLNGPSRSIRHSSFVVRTPPCSFFAALGRDTDMPADVLGMSMSSSSARSSGSLRAIRPRSTKGPRALFPPVHLTGRPPRVNCPRCHANPVLP